MHDPKVAALLADAPDYPLTRSPTSHSRRRRVLDLMAAPHAPR